MGLIRNVNLLRLKEWLDAHRSDVERPTKVAAIALANKLARMAWAMMAKGERNKESVALAAYTRSRRRCIRAIVVLP
jgi:hypothetical protein